MPRWLKIPWVQNGLIWAGIGGGVLFFGGLASHGYRRMMAAPCPDGTAMSPVEWEGLLQLSIGGAIVVGLIGLALTLARSPGDIGWGLGLGAVGLLLFLIFIWPTPYKYDRDKDKRLIRVHRLDGSGDYVVPERSASVSHMCRSSSLKSAAARMK